MKSIFVKLSGKIKYQLIIISGSLIALSLLHTNMIPSILLNPLNFSDVTINKNLNDEDAEILNTDLREFFPELVASLSANFTYTFNPFVSGGKAGDGGIVLNPLPAAVRPESLVQGRLFDLANSGVQIKFTPVARVNSDDALEIENDGRITPGVELIYSVRTVNGAVSVVSPVLLFKHFAENDLNTLSSFKIDQSVYKGLVSIDKILGVFNIGNISTNALSIKDGAPKDSFISDLIGRFLSMRVTPLVDDADIWAETIDRIDGMVTGIYSPQSNVTNFSYKDKDGKTVTITVPGVWSQKEASHQLFDLLRAVSIFSKTVGLKTLLKDNGSRLKTDAGRALLAKLYSYYYTKEDMDNFKIAQLNHDILSATQSKDLSSSILNLTQNSNGFATNPKNNAGKISDNNTPPQNSGGLPIDFQIPSAGNPIGGTVSVLINNNGKSSDNNENTNSNDSSLLLGIVSSSGKFYLSNGSSFPMKKNADGYELDGYYLTAIVDSSGAPKVVVTSTNGQFVGMYNQLSSTTATNLAKSVGISNFNPNKVTTIQTTNSSQNSASPTQVKDCTSGSNCQGPVAPKTNGTGAVPINLPPPIYGLPLTTNLSQIAEAN